MLYIVKQCETKTCTVAAIYSMFFNLIIRTIAIVIFQKKFTGYFLSSPLSHEASLSKNPTMVILVSLPTYLLYSRWRKVQGLSIDVALTCFRSLCGTRTELTHDLIYLTFISYSLGIAETGPKFCSIRYNCCLPNK